MANYCGYVRYVGFLFQSSRFARVYQDYYANRYRNVIFGTPNPSQEFISDQIKKGNFCIIFRNIFIKKGSILDVGSSVGGMMKAFIDKGWDNARYDPDIGFVRYGKENWFASQASKQRACSFSRKSMILLSLWGP